MTQPLSSTSLLTIGLDVGDRITHYCVLDSRREVVTRGRCATRRPDLAEALDAFGGARVILEAGSQSPWMSAALRELGFDVLVADPRRVALISKDPRKTDRRDAEVLARLRAGMPELLGEVHHRDAQAQADIAVLRARDQVVRTRSRVVVHLKSLFKTFGLRIPPSTSSTFRRKVDGLIPPALRPACEPLLELLASLETTIRTYDRRIEELAATRYPVTTLLRQPDGVGPVTSLAFVLTLADPSRFRKSRRVGSYVGLCPRSRASGDSDPKLPISKTGNTYLRYLLVQCAHHILGPHGKDSDLRRFGMQLMNRGGRGARQRAATAVARKVAVLLHRLWVTGECYEPLRTANAVAAPAPA